MAIPIPIKLGQFEIRRKLGAGGMAEVFLAEKRGAEGTFKQLVVKRILPTHKTSPNFRTMFVEEAQLSTRLNHPNVVQVFEFFDAAEEGLLLSMEFVDGTDLGMLMARAKARGKRISPYLSAWMIAEAAKGLHYAHEKKDDSGSPLDIVHRDVSPQNILVSYEGHVKITDFGIASARILEDDDSVLKGKFGYMSPEQARGETAHRTSDIYSLGVVLWELLTGKPMHGGLGGEALLDIVRSGMVDAPSLYSSDIPSDLENVLMRALEPSASQRFVSAKDFSRDLVRTIPGDVVVELGTVLETLIHELIPRESTKLLISPRTDPPPALPPSSLPLLRSPVRRGNAREVRHVALVNLRLHGLDDLRHH
ncbi:MAG: serine/threonine protein kinase, partial [Polyangiaceae bacterium]|nr:serine/threonine protein kinase [Polyangiaceae bacterium]